MYPTGVTPSHPTAPPAHPIVTLTPPASHTLPSTLLSPVGPPPSTPRAPSGLDAASTAHASTMGSTVLTSPVAYGGGGAGGGAGAGGLVWSSSALPLRAKVHVLTPRADPSAGVRPHGQAAAGITPLTAAALTGASQMRNHMLGVFGATTMETRMWRWG